MKNTIALILAAGKGTRMKSKFPKVLHKVGGVPMVEQVLRAVKAAGTQRQVVVVGFGGETVRDYLGDQAETVMQKNSSAQATLSCRPNRCSRVKLAPSLSPVAIRRWSRRKRLQPLSTVMNRAAQLRRS